MSEFYVDTSITSDDSMTSISEHIENDYDSISNCSEYNSPATITSADIETFGDVGMSPIHSHSLHNNIFPDVSTNIIENNDVIMEETGAPVSFIGTNRYLGEKKKMTFFWGPFGIGYYLKSNHKIKSYQSQIEKINKLSLHKKSILHHFIKDINNWKECDILPFFQMLGLEKKSYVNILSQSKSIEKEMCMGCFNIIYPLEKRVKCVSFECLGMCQNCKLIMKENCIACGKKQEIKCPICLEIRPVWASKILRCNHGICWKCYGGALENGHALINCPQCRKAI